MKVIFTILVLSAVLAIGPVPVRAFTVPTAASFSFTASTVGASLIALQGADTDGTSLVYAIAAGPSHGTLSGLDTATGYVVYTPTTSYTGADSFTYNVTSGGQTSSNGTVSITVTNAKTRIVDTLTDSSGTALTGMVTFILTQRVTSPAGLIPASATISATLSAGAFDVSLYPSTALSPQSYYQLWYTATGSLRRELLGVYAIPATSATSITLAPYRVTDTNLAAQYSFMPAAAINSLVTGLGSPVTSFNTRTGAITPATNDYTWAQINKSTSSIADITTRSAADLSSGTLPDARFPSTLPALNGSNLTALNASNLSSGTVAPARLGSMTDSYLPYKTSSAMADSPLLRYGSGTVGFAAGTPAAPSTSNSATGTRLLLLDGASGEHLGIGVESGSFWHNTGAANSYKFYWGASSAEKYTLTPSQFLINSAGTSFTFNFQTSGTPSASVVKLTSNAYTVRIGADPASDNLYVWDFDTDGFHPFTDASWAIGTHAKRPVQVLTQNSGGFCLSDGTNCTGIISGSGDPAGAVISRPGSLYLRTNGLVYKKASGTSTGGWDEVATSANTATFTNKTVDVEGTGNTYTMPFKVFLSAAGCNNATAGSFWDLPTSTAAVPACVTGTNTQKGVLDFADSGPFVAQNTLILPADFTGAIDARIIWTTSATSGNAKWSLATICTDVAASATDDPSFNTASTVTTAAPGTANRVQTSAITGVTATGCSAGNLLHLKISRDGTDGSDTIGATARLVGVEVTIRRAM